jgi:rhodanese-related sulfurtransferase
MSFIRPANGIDSPASMTAGGADASSAAKPTRDGHQLGTFIADDASSRLRTKVRNLVSVVAMTGVADSFAVSDPDEFTGALGNIEGARNFPVADLPTRLRELETLREKLLVVVCHTDTRSTEAAAFLHESGFNQVRVLRGGMARWSEWKGCP